MADQNSYGPGERIKFYQGLIKALVKYAEYEFYFSRQENGASTKEHIQKAKKNAFASLVITKDTFKDIPKKVLCPFELQHVWKWFIELDDTRQNGMTIGPITHTEITNWADGMGIKVLPIERAALRAVDRAYRKFCNTKDEKK